MIKSTLSRFLFSLCLCSFSLLGFAQPQIIKPGKGDFASSFVIVVDKASFEALESEVIAYKNILEGEGLGTYLVYDEWKRPEEVKQELVKIAAQRPLLQGAVFIGQIPVVRIRNAQHLTTAFKMDEVAFPMVESSVTSDRFYDDLHLTFDFIEQDPENPLNFYYKLRYDSPQEINPSFYSGRMLPPSDAGQNAHSLLRQYLQKVVAAHQEMNALDCLVSFTGSFYNSDCLTAWGDEPLAMKEYFPQAFLKAQKSTFLNFRQEPYMRYRLYEQMQRPDVDLFLFHEHGAFDTQYISGGYPATSLHDDMEQLGIVSRNTYRKLRKRGEGRAEAFKQSVLAEHHLPESWFLLSTLDSLRLSDSLAEAAINITLPDLNLITPNARFSLFDACYNGSFHEKGYVAGYHVFGGGKTIVAQGNTVNVLQDKYSTRLLGMLSKGIRIGFWQNEVITLESHLLGDPTYRFVPDTEEGRKLMEALNDDLALHTKEVATWEHYLLQEDPLLQALALKKLSALRPQGLASMIYQIYTSTPSLTLRTECLQILTFYPQWGEARYEEDAHYRKQMLIRAMNDSYELIRRLSARYAGMVGEPELIAPLVNAALFQTESQRVAFQTQSSLEVFDHESVNAMYLKQIGESPKSLANAAKRQAESLLRIGNKGTPQQQRIGDIRYLRNNNLHTQVASLLQILGDADEEVLIRTTLAEALGWFTLSIKKPQIIEAIKELLQHSSVPEALRQALIQTWKRLQPLSSL